MLSVSEKAIKRDFEDLRAYLDDEIIRGESVIALST